MIQDFVDHTFLINLNERTDRLETVTKELNKNNIKFERFSAIKPIRSEIPGKQYNHMTIGGANKEQYVISTCGVKQSHIEIIKIAKDRKYEKILILEDDVVFAENFESVFNLVVPDLNKLDWEMLFFGVNHVKPWIPCTQNLGKIVRAYAIHAYIIRQELYDKLIVNTVNSGKEIDVYYADDIFPHHNCYCVRPTIVWQKAGFSDILQGYRDYKVIRK